MNDKKKAGKRAGIISRSEVEMSNPQEAVDKASIKDICNVLWKKDIPVQPDDLPQELGKEQLEKISPQRFGEEAITMLQSVKTQSLPLVQRCPERYDLLTDLCQRGGLTTLQAYNVGDVMGLDYFKGYAGMKSMDRIEFPRDFGPHNDFQLAWYFFASSLFDQNGSRVDLLVLFTHRTLYPLPIAEAMNLSEMDNKIVEMQLGLDLEDRSLHVQGIKPTISGRTGLVKLDEPPYLVKVGKNEVIRPNADTLSPLIMHIYDPENDIKIDLTLEETKPVFLEGDEGKWPSMFNIGNWYFSMPSMKTTGTVRYEYDEREVSGVTWFDNQWTAGIFPVGYPDSYYIRSLSNILNGLKRRPPEPLGWDWMGVHLDNNKDVVLACPHSVYSKDLDNLGENPPPDDTRDAEGKIIHEDGQAEDIRGTITVEGWERSDASNAWFPNRWHVEVPDKNLELSLTAIAPNQIYQCATTLEFREGGIRAVGKIDGKDITGIGFGEGTEYAGQDYFFKSKFKLLGIDDTPKNRDIFTAPVPGAWLVIQSITLYVLTFIATSMAAFFAYRLTRLLYRRLSQLFSAQIADVTRKEELFRKL